MSESRHHFKIGEVAEMIGVKPHVLRYWEQEFPALRPKKTRGAHRHYSRENVALAREIHALVVDAGYSIAGARSKLLSSRPMSSHAPDDVDDEDGVRGDLIALRTELIALLDFVEGRTTSLELDDDEVGDDELLVPVTAPATRTRVR